MAASRPEKCEYLAVVSEWSNYAKSGTLVGNAYPVFNLTEQAVVEDPLEEFPNPGAVFLTNRGELKSGDFVRLHPTLNQYYSSADEIRNCYYIAAKMPQRLTGRPDLPGAAVLLDVPRFDPLADRGVIRNPAQYVTPLFFVRTAQGRIFGPLQRVQVNRTP